MTKLSIVDLAGTERQNKTGATGTTFKEGSLINTSLTGLSRVVRALAAASANGATTGAGGVHVPFRDSKLTRLLRDSLGGSSLLTMLLHVSSDPFHVPETLSTLRFGARARTGIHNTIKAVPAVPSSMSSGYRHDIEAEAESVRKSKEKLELELRVRQRMIRSLAQAYHLSTKALEQLETEARAEQNDQALEERDNSSRRRRTRNRHLVLVQVSLCALWLLVEMMVVSKSRGDVSF